MIDKIRLIMGLSNTGNVQALNITKEVIRDNLHIRYGNDLKYIDNSVIPYENEYQLLGLLACVNYKGFPVMVNGMVYRFELKYPNNIHLIGTFVPRIFNQFAEHCKDKRIGYTWENDIW